MQKKAISLLSGGLDSTLATKIIAEQGIEVLALHFTSLFCNCSGSKNGCGLQAAHTANELNVEIMVRNKGEEYLDVVRNPKHGYGRNMNPCIDCRIFILQKTKEIMEEIGASFVITGEVLGQRPMSQRRRTMELIEQESGLEGLIVRPLSAKYLPPSLPEQMGIVDRERLLGITGRSRKPQYELARTFDLTEFGCPGGGCLLTDPIFAKKLKDLFSHGPHTPFDVALLKIGRHFRIKDRTKVILGRNQAENERLTAMAVPPYTLLSPVGFKGPVGLVSGDADDTALGTASNLMALYSKGCTYPVTIEVRGKAFEPAQILTFEKMELDKDVLII